MMIRRAYTIALSLLSAAIPCNAQQNALTVDEVLLKVRAHMSDYRSSVPSFISDESVDSLRFSGDVVKDEMKWESTFEVVRKATGDGMRETRTFKLVNGTVPKNQNVEPPFIWRGGVADAINFIENTCNNYYFAEAPGKGGPIVISASLKPPSGDRPTACKQSQNVKAFIDPETFQVSRIETAIQDINFGIAGHVPFVPVPSDHNVLTVAIDYGPVELGGKTYWLTKTVTSDCKDKKKPIHLHYEAHYTNYHRYAATSVILPGDPAPIQN